MSLPEVMLWQQLRGGRAGAKFRRQHPLGPYVADFFCKEAGLVVEIDGQVHAERLDFDAARDRYLVEQGFEVLRISASDVLRDVEAIADAIAVRVTSPLHHAAHSPPPRAGEEQE